MVLALISGEASPLVDRLASSLGSATVYKNCKDKASALRTFSGKARIAFAGDLLHWRRCKRFARAQHRRSQRLPADARPRIRKLCQVVTKLTGGNGAVREVVDMLLASTQKRRQNRFARRA